MLPACDIACLSQNPSTENGQFHAVVLILAWMITLQTEMHIINTVRYVPLTSVRYFQYFERLSFRAENTSTGSDSPSEHSPNVGDRIPRIEQSSQYFDRVPLGGPRPPSSARAFCDAGHLSPAHARLPSLASSRPACSTLLGLNPVAPLALALALALANKQPRVRNLEFVSFGHADETYTRTFPHLCLNTLVLHRNPAEYGL